MITHAESRPTGNNQANAYKGDIPSTSAGPLINNRFQALQNINPDVDTAPHLETVVADTPMEMTVANMRDYRVEDSDCEGLEDINRHQNLQGHDENVTRRGEPTSVVDPFEYPLLVDAMASTIVKKKKWGGRKSVEQGLVNPGGSSRMEVLPTNLAVDFQNVVEGLAVVEQTLAESSEPRPSPPSVRHRSKSRGPRKEVTSGSSVKKKIEKYKRSLSCNNRPLGVSDLLPPPQ